MKRFAYLYIVALLAFVGCSESIVSTDPSLRLILSTDSLAFDTVFTGFGTSTSRVVLRNPNDYAIVVEKARLRDGRYFSVNVDGESDTLRWHDITIRGGDSAYIFVRAYVDVLGQDNPLIIEDALELRYNGTSSVLRLSAIGQDVHLLKKCDYRSAQHLTADKPYLVLDTLIYRDSLTIDAGAVLYMGNAATIFALGDVEVDGTLDNHVRIRGARTDKLFDSVPYSVASGQWNGIYMLQSGTETPTWAWHYTDIWSGNVGLFCQSERMADLPTLEVDGCMIHNMSVYGIVCINTDATIRNTEVSNCADYGVYLQGGTHTLVHNTIAAYFGYPYTNINIHSVSREDVAAVYVNNLSKRSAPMQTYMYNNIITGARRNNLLLALPLPEYYRGEFKGNYLRADTFMLPQFADNVYAGEDDTVFVNNHYLYKEYTYFDFHLDSLSAAIGIGDVDKASSLPYDRDGRERLPRPDAGCYQHRTDGGEE